ncbi:MAG: Unknown protein [uncultured Sulfurovum sp.]|uniref:Uncharacterized protein n=1 Tax=uncultured Sulfurovum sp. TaxID=269237 RepID=A0A6S6SQ09_9BACT|nr:MAG: Unknown protein [uncultured Sulfurovum sp.]
MNFYRKRDSRDGERRKKRLVMPFIYFIAESIFLWLVISLFQLEFDIREWHIVAIILLSLGVFYSIAKTIHIFQRQRNLS